MFSVKLYDSDVNLTDAIKREPIETPCMQSSQFCQWVNMSINADKTAQNNDQFYQPDFSAQYKEDVEWGERLINETKHLFQFPTVNTRDFGFESCKNYTSIHQDLDENHIVPELDQTSWFERPLITEDIFSTSYEASDDLSPQEDYFSEHSSDSESNKKDDELFERIKERPSNPWATQNCYKTQPCIDTKPQPTKLTAKRCKTSFKSGRPRLCQFLLELLNDPAKYSNLIEWLDKDKGIFKFLNSSRVAKEWGTRRNKPQMKYENFARSLRTYIAKGILTKPRSKLVYRFSSI